MFYDIFVQLAKQFNKSPSAVADELGFSRGTVTNWKKKGITPNIDILIKIADYFDVSTDYLQGRTNEKKPPAFAEGFEDELIAFYGGVKEHLTEGDIEDIKTIMRIKAEMNKDKVSE